MAAVSTSEKSVNFYETTRCNIPEDGHLHEKHCQNFWSSSWESTTCSPGYEDNILNATFRPFILIIF
jgi:hypothetical protein